MNEGAAGEREEGGERREERGRRREEEAGRPLQNAPLIQLDTSLRRVESSAQWRKDDSEVMLHLMISEFWFWFLRIR